MTRCSSRKKARDLRHGVAAVVEAHEEPLLAFRAAHGGLEGVHVRPPGLVLLLHLDGEPAFLQREFIRAGLAHMVHRGDGEDAPVNAHVAHLRLVLAPAEGDDGPVLKLEGRDGVRTSFTAFDPSLFETQSKFAVM